MIVLRNKLFFNYNSHGLDEEGIRELRNNRNSLANELSKSRLESNERLKRMNNLSSQSGIGLKVRNLKHKADINSIRRIAEGNLEMAKLNSKLRLLRK